MKKILIHILVLCMVFSRNNAQTTNHVILITIDGFRPEFYLDSTYGMFTVRKLMHNGIAAKEAEPVFPSVTYPNHTSLVTGMYPSKHGIFYNTPFEANGQTGTWYWDYHSIKTETLWDIMKKSGIKTACVKWPVTVDAPIDYRIPEYWLLDNKNQVQAAAMVCNPSGLWKEVQDNATGRLLADDWTSENNELINDENVSRIASYIFQKHKPGFMAVHLGNVDHYEHQIGREGYIVRASVAGADRAIKGIVEGIARAGLLDSTTLIITGDHGFQNIRNTFNPNYLLKQAGLLNNRTTGNWKARFLSQGGSTFLHLKNMEDTVTLKTVYTLLSNLPDSTKEKFSVIDNSRLLQIGADPYASLALTGLEGTAFGDDDKKLITYLAQTRGTHGFLPDHHEIMTGFVAAGPGIKKNYILSKIRLIDIAPTIALLMGVKLLNTDGIANLDVIDK